MQMITVVTGNSVKYTEISEALSRHAIATEQARHDLVEPQTLDLKAIVTAKVNQAFDACGGAPVLVDDTGFFIDRYNEFPGVFAKFVYQGLGFDGLHSLYVEEDKAHFRCYVAYRDASLAEPQIFCAEYEGVLTHDFEHPDDDSMPYADMFRPHDGDGLIMSSMTPQQRSNDHRHTAVGLFAAWYLANRAE